MADREGCLDSRVLVGLGSPCEPEEVVETGAWLSKRVGIWPGSLWKLQVVIDIEARLQTRLRVGPVSLCKSKVLVETGPWL